MRIAVIGAGAVGARASRQLLTVPGVDEVLVVDEQEGKADAVAGALAVPSARACDDWLSERPDAVLLAVPPGHRDLAEQALAIGAHVVSVSDAIDDAEELRLLDGMARAAQRCVVIGAGFSPGLTCLLAVHAASELDGVDEVHVAKDGTGGPACAHQHHTALASEGRDWRDGQWITTYGGTGRELCWFPDPVGGRDCYRAALADSLLLHPLFPEAARITARMSATRRDRLTARLPMLRKPHLEAGPGAVRVELRGRRDGMASVVVFGAMDRPSVAAGAVAAVSVGQVLAGETKRTGAGGVGELLDPAWMLAELARRGVKAARFEGATR